MVIYNVTIKITWSITDGWVEWMKQTHIPAVLATGCFTNHQFVKLLDIDEVEGPTYAVQYFADSKANLDEYIDRYATSLRQDTIDKWRDQFIAFRTLMEVVK